MRFLLTILLFLSTLSALEVKSGYWKSGETLLTFFEKHKIPQKLYYNLKKLDQELCAEIYAGARYFMSYEKDRLTEVLIPISEDMQIKIYREKGEFRFTTIPISYTTVHDSFVIELQNSPYYDIVKHTGLKDLADEFVAIYKNSIDFSRSIRRGDKLVISYSQNMRLGKPHGNPKIETAMIETNKRPHYLFNYKSRYFNEDGKEIEGFTMLRPVRNSWISSRFTKKRWHPILKRYRAHLGVDYAANRGTPIRAAASGKVIHKGRKGGYGNTIIISHRSGFRTLYAHMKGYKRGIYRGKYVKRGQIIGYVGSTGLSTGPHLHFGLYKRGAPINPLHVVKVARTKLKGKEKQKFKTVLQEYKTQIKQIIASKATPKHIDILEDGDYITEVKVASAAQMVN